MKYKNNEIIEIEWQDTASTPRWVSKSEMLKDKPAQCRTVGYFKKQNKNCITVAKSICGEDGDGLDPQTIPCGCIKKIKRLRKH